MKKWIAGIAVLILLLTICVYIFIPSTIRVSGSVIIEGPSKALIREEYEKGDWSKWWTGKISGGGKTGGVGTVYQLNGFTYTIRDRKYNSLDIDISDGETTSQSSMLFVANTVSSAEVIWTTAISTSANPLSRFSRWRHASRVQSAISKVLKMMQASRADDVKVYGLRINRENLKDTLLMSTYIMTTHYPGKDTVYQLIDQIRNHGKKYGVRELGKPMLNISYKAGTDSLLVRVAIPVDKRIPSSGNMSYKLMPPNVQMLTATVTGGAYAAETGMQTVDHYATDHLYTPPAIPYFILETDRRTEADSTKWVTRIFYPIM